MNKQLSRAMGHLGPIRAHRRSDGQMTLDQKPCLEGDIMRAATRRREQLQRMYFGMESSKA